MLPYRSLLAPQTHRTDQSHSASSGLSRPERNHRKQPFALPLNMRLHVTKTLNVWHHFLLFRKKHWGLNDPTKRRQRKRLRNKQRNKQNWLRRNFHFYFARTSHFFVDFVCRICGYDVKWPSFTMYIIWMTSHKQATTKFEIVF